MQVTEVQEPEMEAVMAPTTPADDISGTYVTFDLNGQNLGVEVRHVRAILDTTDVSQLPNATHEVEGVIDVRGESIPIIDIGSRLGMPRQSAGSDTRIIVFEFVSNGALRPVGILADRVRDVTEIAVEEIEAPPEIVGATWRGELLRGFARHAGFLIMLLNAEAIFMPGGSDGASDFMSF